VDARRVALTDKGMMVDQELNAGAGLVAGRVYLDANATTRPFPEVVETVAHHLRQSYANPGSRHAEGRQARRVLEDSREKIAELLGANPGEVVFTSGGTEATNMALQGFAGGTAGTVLITAGEHPATVETCRALAQRGWSLHELDVDQQGRLVQARLPELPWKDVRLATVILAHNETGVIQDTAALAALCREHGVPLHLDAVQAVGKMPVRFRELSATSMAVAAHKFHGPRGIGALLVRDGARLAPLMFGGHQEAERRPGTEVVALAAGMARALELCLADLDARVAALSALRNGLESGLREACGPVVVNGSAQYRLPNTLNVSFPGVDGEALLVALDLDGISCSLGSTCASGSAEPSPVLVAMGCPEDVTDSAVRFSVSVDNHPDEIPEAVRRIAAAVKRLRTV